MEPNVVFVQRAASVPRREKDATSDLVAKTEKVHEPEMKSDRSRSLISRSLAHNLARERREGSKPASTPLKARTQAKEATSSGQITMELPALESPSRRIPITEEGSPPSFCVGKLLTKFTLTAPPV
jgi:hypothetical protein